MVEPGRIVIVALPSMEAAGEIGIDPATEVEVAFLAPSRLLVLARHAAHTAVHLVDPYGPTSLAEIQLAAAVGLFASVGPHTLVIGAQGAAILTAGDAHLAPYQFPARARPTAAGVAANQFVVAVPGVIEEWDPAARIPKRRLRLPRPTHIAAVGGSERVVWMVAQQEPARVDVLTLINRGQPKHHDLPEPIAFDGSPAIVGHPRSDLLAVIGAESRRAYAIDLDGRTALRALAFPGIDRVDAIALVGGRTVGAIAAQQGRPLAFSPLEARDSQTASIVVTTHAPVAGDITDPLESDAGEDLAAAPRSSLVEELSSPDAPIARRARLESPFATATPTLTLGTSPASIPTDAPASTPASRAGAASPPTPSRTGRNLAERFAAVRARRELVWADGGSRDPHVPMAPASDLDVTATSPDAKSRPHVASESVDAARGADVTAAWPDASAGHAASTHPPVTAAPPASARPEAAFAPAVAPTPPVPTHLPVMGPSGEAPAAPSASAAKLGAVAAPISTVLQAAASLARELVSPSAATPSSSAPTSPSTGAWRDACAAWARACVEHGEIADVPVLVAIDELADRFELSRDVRPALALVYGAHLAGHDGVAPVEVARAVAGLGDERRWAEALGRGELAAAGVVTYERSRVRLAAAVRGVLDELPAATGTLVGVPGTIALLGACVLVAEAGASLLELAARQADRAGGAILVGHDDRGAAEVGLEARAIGAVPMLMATRYAGDGTPAIYVASDEDEARRLGLPQLL